MKEYNPKPLIIMAALTAATLAPMIAERKKEEENHYHTEVEKDNWCNTKPLGLYAATTSTTTTTTTTLL
jgi:hypothetical protein